MRVTHPQRSHLVWALTAVAVLGLAYDAYVHFDLAPAYDAIKKDISQGFLFRVEAVSAILAALAILLTDNKLAWLGAAGVALGGVFAVVLYRYVDVGAIGPLPNMYEPVWYGWESLRQSKNWSVVFELAAGVACLARVALLRKAPQTA